MADLPKGRLEFEDPMFRRSRPRKAHTHVATEGTAAVIAEIERLTRRLAVFEGPELAELLGSLRLMESAWRRGAVSAELFQDEVIPALEKFREALRSDRG